MDGTDWASAAVSCGSLAPDAHLLTVKGPIIAVVANGVRNSSLLTLAASISVFPAWIGGTKGSVYGGAAIDR